MTRSARVLERYVPRSEAFTTRVVLLCTIARRLRSEILKSKHMQAQTQARRTTETRPHDKATRWKLDYRVRPYGTRQVGCLLLASAAGMGELLEQSDKFLRTSLFSVGAIDLNASSATSNAVELL